MSLHQLIVAAILLESDKKKKLWIKNVEFYSSVDEDALDVSLSVLN